MRTDPLLICGLGRSGTTVLADCMATQPGLLRVEEPNFVESLVVPFVRGDLTACDVVAGLDHEGWRGPMKICRTITEDYPDTFGVGGPLPIRTYLRECLCALVARPPEDARAIAMLDTIIDDTCRAAGAATWLIKQPSAILEWETLTRWWPGMRILFVGRLLHRTVLSRVKRGFQSSVVGALDVCVSRFRAALDMRSEVPERISFVSIDAACADPLTILPELCSFLGTPPSEQVRRNLARLDLARLTGLGDPAQHFTREELARIEHVRGELNARLGWELL